MLYITAARANLDKAETAYSLAAVEARKPENNPLAQPGDPFEPLPEWGVYVGAASAAIEAGVDPKEINPGVLLALGYRPVCDTTGRVLSVRRAD